MARGVNCTEQQQLLTDIAVLLANTKFQGEINMVDKVADEMSKNIVGMNRQLLVDSIVAASGLQQATIDDIRKILGSTILKREAKTDNTLKEAMADIHEAIKSDALLPTKAEQRQESDYISKLRHYTAMMRRAYNASTAKTRERMQKQIDALQADIQQFLESGDTGKAKKGEEFVKGTEDLIAERSLLRSRLRELRREAGKRRADEQAENGLIEAIETLEKHLEDGSLPQTMKRQQRKRSESIEMLRSARRRLQAVLNQSTQSREAKLQKTLEMLDARLKAMEDGSYVKPTKPSPATSKAIEDLEYRIHLKKAEVQRRINDMKPPTFLSRTADVVNFARAMMTSMDFSAVLRQGGFITFAHPVRAAQAMLPMIKAAVSDKYAVKLAKEIENDPYAPIWTQADLEVTDLNTAQGLMTQQEEKFITRLLQTLPEYKRKLDYANPFKLIKSTIQGSERAYVTFLNKMRVDSFKALHDTLAINGTPTREEAKAIANFVNVATGRGNLRNWNPAQNATEFLNTIFFAPRYTLSRFQLLTLQPLIGKESRQASQRVRRQLAKEYARFAIGLSLVHMLVPLAALATAGDDDDDVSFKDGTLKIGKGYSFELDPRSTDFLKHRFGQSRIELSAGLAQYVVLADRIATGQQKDHKGKIKPLRQSYIFGDQKAPGFGQKTMWDKLTSFGRYKLSPVANFTVSSITGKDPIQRETTPWKAAGDMFTVLSLKDVAAAIEDQGLPRGPALGAVSILGGGLNVYDERDK